MRTAVFTIVSLNYLPFAMTLMDSLRSIHPAWDRHVLLVDRANDEQLAGKDLYHVTTVEALPLPNMREFLFRYGIMELNTAVKPYMFRNLRKQGYDRVVYFDPDILVIDKLLDIEHLLDEGRTAVITPHLTAPMDDGLQPTELDILRAGSYNLGFIAVNGLPVSDKFISWWAGKLEYGAGADPDRGVFTDQKWIDLAPGMFGEFAILRDPGYNVAYWNVPHRPITRRDGAWFAALQPLRFFHFSGFDPLNPEPFSKHQNRLTLSTIGPARELALQYAQLVLDRGFEAYRHKPYAFGAFSNGVSIPRSIRSLYRKEPKLRKRARPDPFEKGDYFVRGEADGLPLILYSLWQEHAYLRQTFPSPFNISRAAFYRWFIETGALELGVHQAFVEPVRRAVRQNGFGGQITVSPSSWSRMLVSIHKRITGGKISIPRQQEYNKITGPISFLRVAFRQLRAPDSARKAGSATPIRRVSLRALEAARNHRADVSSNKLRLAMSRAFWGFFVESGKVAWWMGRAAGVRVEQPTSTCIRIMGIHYGEAHKRAHGTEMLTLQVGFNDAPRKSIAIPSGEFDVMVDLEEVPEDWPFALHLYPSKTFIPSEIGLNEDDRQLSIQVSEIYVGSTRVFTASEPVASCVSPASPAPAVNVIGYARSEHGVGQALRQFVLALDAASIPSAIIDFNRNNRSRTGDGSLLDRIVEEPVHNVNVFHINADQMPAAELSLPSHLFARYNIGFWNWELPELPPEYYGSFSQLDEVWAPSGFVQDAVSKCSPVPVVRMPHAVRFSISEQACRSHFGLPESKFLFLMMYDFSSYQERKNPKAALEAFDRVFGKGGKAALVIKTQNSQFHEADCAALRDFLSGREDVLWIDRTLSRQEIYDLEYVCDALVSLHRSEGYGFALAEAMFLGKPVIATNWSGNTEFMTPQNSLPVNYRLIAIDEDIGVYKAGQVWADPDVEQAAFQMRKIVEDDNMRKSISREARRTMISDFSPEAIGQKIRARLDFIADLL